MTSSDNDSGEIGAVSAAVEHRFADPELLLTALTHRSYAAEHPGSDDYERLEFLGDAVLELAVTRMLFDTFPDLKEGELTSLLQSVVSEAPLAGIARDLAIPAALRLGAGEDLSGGREKDSILSDAGEAVLGAVFVLRMQHILPYALCFAAGAMIFVVVEELIPESQRNEKNIDMVTMATMVGFAVMMSLDVALG